MSEINEKIEQLIQRFLPRIKKQASKYYYAVQSVLELDDLVSAGIKGLIEAVYKYDPSVNVPLDAFVDFKVKCAIIDEVRSLDSFSKEYRKKIEDVKKAYNHLKKQGHEPTDEEIAEHLNISHEELNKIYQSITASDVISLDKYIEGESGDKLNILDIISDKKDLFENIKLNELKQKLTQAINKLTETEKIVISLYYYEDLNLKEIAHILGVKLPRASQIHGKALMKIKNFLDIDDLKDIL